MGKILRTTIAAVSLSLAACASFFSNASAPTNLTVGEFFTNPLGYALEDLSFSWRLPAGRQTAYQILVAKDSSMAADSLVWDSGKVVSDQNVKVEYPKKVASREKLFWKVRYWDGGKQFRGGT